MPKKSNRETVTIGGPSVVAARKITGAGRIEGPIVVVTEEHDPDGPRVCPECNGATQTGYTCPTCNGRQVLAELFETETNAMNAAIDAKEARLDAYGYGGGSADPGALVGLADSVPSGDTASNGDTDRTPDAG